MCSILDFWYQMTAHPLLFIAEVLTFGVILQKFAVVKC